MMLPWQENQPAWLRCIDKFPETPNSVSIKLAPIDGPQLFDFKPGQFINLGVTMGGQTQFRAYSISSQTQSDHLQLTIKRVPDGQVSNYIVDSLAIGDNVQALPPTGDFNCIDHPPQLRGNTAKALLVSAGCGITPVFAMAQHWLKHHPEIDIEFLHVAKSPEQTIYFKKLQHYAATYDHFHLRLLLKNSGTSGYPQGRFNQDWLEQWVPDLNERSVYLCGPSQFMQDVQSYLMALDFDMQYFFHESFTPTPPTTDAPTQVSQSQSVQPVNIRVPAYEKTLQAHAGDVLADVLEQAQLPIVMACRSGICGSCQCKVNQGQVSSTSQGPLTAEEIEQGYVLACSSTIESDLDIQIG